MAEKVNAGTYSPHTINGHLNVLRVILKFDASDQVRGTARAPPPTAPLTVLRARSPAGGVPMTISALVVKI
jgi:hypothetical protein